VETETVETILIYAVLEEELEDESILERETLEILR